MSSPLSAAIPGKVLRANATGNRFLLLDRLQDETDEASARETESHLAPAICRSLKVDGLLTMAAPLADGDLRMVLHNADGGRAEACGNGLRILACAWHAHHAAPRAKEGPFVIETDAGPRAAWPLPDTDGKARRARVSLGEPRLVSADENIRTPQAEVLAHIVDVGNPHCVVFVADLARVDLAHHGPALERHPRFPARTNVEFVQRAGDGLRLRVWERGVGETDSCGSGVVAAAFVARELHGQAAPLRVETRGGHLRVSFLDTGEALLEGPAQFAPLSTEERVALGSLTDHRASAN